MLKDGCRGDGVSCNIAKSPAGCLTGASPWYSGLVLMGYREPAGLRVASKEGDLQAQSSSFLFPLVSLPQGGVTPSKSQVVSSSPVRGCRGCVECQHIPPALWFSPKPRSGRLARSSRYVVYVPGGAGVLSLFGHLVRLALKRDCSGPVGSVCRGWPSCGPAAGDVGECLAALREPE